MVKFNIKDLNIWFGASHALKSVSFQIQANEILSVIGPANSGKTTFLRMLNRLNELEPNFKIKGSVIMKNLMKDLLPQRLIERFLKNLHILEELKTNQITQEQRRAIVTTLKAFPLTIKGSLPIEEAMITGGGVSVKEINPRTMESKVVPGLYFAGELIEGSAASGGYNLQQAFSTGYLAGEKAAQCAE